MPCVSRARFPGATRDVGEVGATALQFIAEAEGVSAAAFVFKGANERGGHDRIANLGFALGFAHESDAFELSANAGYINDIAEAGAFQDSEDFDASMGSAVAGAHASIMAKLGPVSLIGEYVSALKAFKTGELDFRGSGAKPSAWSLEAALGLEVMNSEITAAASYQQTKQAVKLGLPENRYLIGVSVGIVEGISVATELSFDKDYSETDEGSGKNATKLTVVFAAEF